MANDDNVIRPEKSWGQRELGEDELRPDDGIREAPASAAQMLADDAKANGGSYAEDPDYQGAFGRTLFDDRASEDGTVTVVFPPP